MQIVKDKFDTRVAGEIAMTGVRNNTKLTHFQFRVFDALWRGHGSWKPTYDTLASQYNVSPEYVRQSFKALEKHGYVKMKFNGNLNNLTVHLHPIPVQL